MKKVLISIKPKWCELIASGKNTIEVRKTAPKIERPFKVYIYETQGRTETPWIDEEGHHIFKGRGQVIGEFICDEVMTLWAGYAGEHGDCCLTYDEMENYLGVEENGITNKSGYGWHISDLVIYDKPKELSEFGSLCDGIGGKIGCKGCEYYYHENTESGSYEECCCNYLRPLKRPPQSWCYVEVEK